MARAQVYLDSNIYKFSATRLLRFRPRNVAVSVGGHERVFVVYDPLVVNPNDRIRNPELKAEADLLPEVAALSEKGLVRFVITTETQVEVSGIPDLDSQTGYFFRTDRQIVDPPVKYSRILYGGTDDYWQDQFKFLLSLTDERFLELQRITGAYQGRAYNRNQVLDAFHLWCAEHSSCDFFLTLDFKLAKVIERAKRKPMVPVLRPSQLLTAIRSGNWRPRSSTE